MYQFPAPAVRSCRCFLVALAILATFPAICRWADVRVDILSAQTECTAEDINGKPRACTATEEFDFCLEQAILAADARAENGEGSKLAQFLEFSADVAGCVLVSPFRT